MTDTAVSNFELLDGKYRLDLELGSGTFGSVYRATQFALGRSMRQVALKLFKSDAIDPDNVHEQFSDALTLIDLLSNENDWEVRQHFVTVFDLGLTQEQTPRSYVSMELVRGGSLAGRIRDDGKFTLSGTRYYLRQLLPALAFMHRNQCVHGALKPENILVFTGRGQDLVKIGDFGLSGRPQGSVGSGPRGGTLSYLALEALCGAEATPGCDVFSLGLIAYEMLTGTNPYNKVGKVGATLFGEAGESLPLMNELHRKSRETPLRLFRGDFPELSGAHPDPVLGGMLDLINRMLEPYPGRRFASADAAWSDFLQLEGKVPAAVACMPNRAAGNGSVVTEAPSSPLAQDLKSQCESEISLGRFGQAAQLANRLIKVLPHDAESYLLKSRVFLEQARQQQREGIGEQVVVNSRKQAVTPLKKGLRQCVDAQQQRRLKQELADVYRLLGDDAAARTYLS